MGGESASLLEAELDGGKYYYVEVDPRMGVWKGRFAFVPVSGPELQSGKFLNKLAQCQWYTSGPGARAWFEDNRSSLLEKRGIAFDKHQGAEGDKCHTPHRFTGTWNLDQPG